MLGIIMRREWVYVFVLLAIGIAVIGFYPRGNVELSSGEDLCPDKGIPSVSGTEEITEEDLLVPVLENAGLTESEIDFVINMLSQNNGLTLEEIIGLLNTVVNYQMIRSDLFNGCMEAAREVIDRKKEEALLQCGFLCEEDNDKCTYNPLRSEASNNYPFESGVEYNTGVFNFNTGICEVRYDFLVKCDCVIKPGELPPVSGGTLDDNWIREIFRNLW
jgi:hypothetical protein